MPLYRKYLVLIRVNPYFRILAKNKAVPKQTFWHCLLLCRDFSFLSAQSQAVVLHAVCEILQVGFEREQHALHLWKLLCRKVVLELGILRFVVETEHLLSIKMEHPFASYHLVHLTNGTDGKVWGRGREHIVPETDHFRLLQVEEVEESREEVGLLESIVRGAHPFFASIVEEERDAKMPYRVVIFWSDACYGVVGGDDEERITKPRLRACCLEEFAQRHIRVANQGVIRHFVTREHLFIALGKMERVV